MLFSLHVFSQQIEKNTNKVLRVNFLNPGLEYEIPVLKKSTIAFNLGVGYGASYPELTIYASGWLYMLSPFLDLHYKCYYNLDKRASKGKNICCNSGNFWGLRVLARGEAIKSNFIRTSDYDFSIEPTWGLQRSFGKMNLLFDLGVNYYFDAKGNSGFSPMLELNIGYNIDFKKK